MKVLLDEDLPHRARLFFQAHEVSTVVYNGFAGLKNGHLLDAAESADFDVFLTADKKMRSQQNMAGRRLALVVLCAQSTEELSSFRVEISSAIHHALPGEVSYVDWLSTNPETGL